MGDISNMPLVRMFIPFLAGIISATSFNISLPIEGFLLFVFLILTFFIIIYHYDYINYNHRWISGTIISVFLFTAGNIITINYNQLNKANHYSNFYNGEYAILQITEPVSERENSYRLTGKVRKIISDSLEIKTQGKVMLYLAKDSLASIINYGDWIITKNRFDRVQSPQNPYQFNYQRYLAFENIHYQGYRSSGQYMIIASGKGNRIKSMAINYRSKALEILQKYNIHNREFAVVSALLLGYREYIDDEMRQQFAGAGAMHILCVSGLHVGIIYIILNTILAFLERIKYGKKFKAVIIILLIWFYAALTGFSPSVLRASTMFTFVAFAKSINRYTNIYNILAASAFVLTIIDPYIITKIGFQLSYLAVISIVFLQPYMYKALYFKKYIPDKIWAIITVSIAAQIATGPLALYYFNQFPNYFILTNLAVIPLASIIIYTSLLFLLFSPVSFIATLISKILSFFVFVLHSSVKFVDSLPYSNLQNINLAFYETLLVFALVILISGIFIKKSKLYLQLALPVLILLITSFSLKNIKQQIQKGFVVYSINNKMAIDFISGNESVFVINNEFLENYDRNIGFNINQNRVKKGIKTSNTINIENDSTVFAIPYFWKMNNYILFNDLRIKIVNNYDNTSEINSPINLDYVIISENPEINIKQIKEQYTFNKIIFDSSNSYWNVIKWEEECKELGLEYWSTRNNGAYSNFF